MDKLLFFQSLYFLQFNNLLVGNNNIIQFYNGWNVINFKFFINIYQKTIPNQYYEVSSPETFKLTTLDTNFIRNAGSTLSFLTIFTILFFLYCISLVLNKKYKDKGRMLLNIYRSVFDFCCVDLLYWAFANLMYSSSGFIIDPTFYQNNKIISAVCIAFIALYACILFYFYRIAEIHIFKKFFVCLILAASAYDKQGFVSLLILIIALYGFIKYKRGN
jgi:hypothetical protein